MSDTIVANKRRSSQGGNLIRFGVHCSLRNGLCGSLEEAHELGCEAMQIFTRSPRMWHMRMPEEKDVVDFIALRQRYDIRPLVVHTPYLPNLATANAELYEKSVVALHDDLRVAERIHADYFVIHPGSFSELSTKEEGIAHIVSALNGAFSAVEGRVMVLLENVAGGGRRIGSGFSEIRALIDGVKQQERIGVCLDTAHALGAGYDLATCSGIDRTLKEFDEVVGMKQLKMLHCNDSMAPLGSNKDRHEHLGKGHVGEEGFKYLISRLKHTVSAGILETPKEPEGADRKNLSLLFRWRDSKKD